MSEMVEVEAHEATPVLVRSRLVAYIELTKPRIALLVLAATAAGFYLALPVATGLAILPLLFHTLLGTACVSAGANALNQYFEAEWDAKMVRTANRPIPSGRLTPTDVLTFGVLAGVVGAMYLAVQVNVLTGVLATLSLTSYLFIYTPLKRITPLCVFVGAIPGALPPVIGWAGAVGSLSLGALLLFAIIYFWQLPHVASIAWLYRDDYARAGYPVLPAVDRDGTRTSLHVMTHTVGLLAASLFPTMYGLTGPGYAVGAIVLGVAFLACGVVFAVRRSDEVARLHLFASVMYLPALLVLMMVDKAWL